MGQPSVWAARGWTPERLAEECNAAIERMIALDDLPTPTALADELGTHEDILERYWQVDDQSAETEGRTGGDYALYGPVVKDAYRRCKRLLMREAGKGKIGAMFLAKACYALFDVPLRDTQGDRGTSVTVNLLVPGGAQAGQGAYQVQVSLGPSQAVQPLDVVVGPSIETPKLHK